MKNGGKRPGAGRKKGSLGKVTRQVKEKLVKMLASGEELPLDFLLREMRAKEPRQREGEGALAFKVRYEDWSRRTMAAAQAAVGYCHNRLSSVEHTGKDGDAIKHTMRMEVEFVTPPKGPR